MPFHFPLSLFPFPLSALVGCALIPLATSSARAQADDAPLHPLALDSTMVLIDSIVQSMGGYERFSTLDAIRKLEVYEGVEVGEDGEVRRFSGVREPQRDFGPPEQDASLPVEDGWISDDVASWLVRPERDSTMRRDVQFTIGFPSGSMERRITERLEAEVAEGLILNDEDWKWARGKLVDERRQAGAALLDTFMENLVLLDDWREVSRNTLTPSIIVSMTAHSLSTIAANVNGVRIDFDTASENDFECDVVSTGGGDGGAAIDGEELEGILQMLQFYDDGHFGGGQTIGVNEGHAAQVHRGHRGFGTATDNSDRYTNCSYPFCTNRSGSGGEGAHATASASVALGSIAAGQDPAFTTGSPGAIQRSGVARSALGFGVTSDFRSWAISRLTSENNGVDVITRSSSSAEDDPTCTGATGRSRDWNAVFESGWPIFNSTGNGTNNVADDCRVRSPATALGVFSVSQHIYGGADAAVPVIGGLASRGGTSTEGRDRTIVDITIPTPFEFPYRDYPSSPPGTQLYGADFNAIDGVGEFFCCSSMATPAVAGAATVFRGWWLDDVSTTINDPGRLYTNLLLMGDRSAETGPLLDSGFDSMWGAGTLHMRKFDASGLDGPAKWITGKLYMDEGDDVYILLSSGTLSSDVDVIKAVVTFYDDAHDTSATRDMDNISLRLQRSTDGLAWQTVVTSADDDNKQRVFYDGAIGGYTWRLWIRGWDIDNPGGDIPVWYAYLYEDSDREVDDVHECVRPEDQ